MAEPGRSSGKGREDRGLLRLAGEEDVKSEGEDWASAESPPSPGPEARR